MTTPRRYEFQATATITDDPDRADDAPIIVTSFALPWDVEVEANAIGDLVSFAPGSVEVPAGVPGRVKFLRDHQPGTAFGYGIAGRDTGTGLEVDMAIPRDELADPDTARVVRQMGNGIRDAVSVGVRLLEFTEEPIKGTGAYRIRVTRAALDELSSAEFPRFDDARIASIAASRTQAARHPEPTPDPDPDPDRSETDMPDTDDDLEVDEETNRLNNHRAASRRGATLARPRDLYGSIGRFAFDVAAGGVDLADRRRLGFALTDVLTSDIAGLLPPQWVTDFAEELNNARPSVEAFDSRALPDTGMTVTYPIKSVAGPLVAAQGTQKTEIESGKVSVTTGTATVATYAGGNDVSIQAIQRSSPDYLDLLFQEYGYELAHVHNTALVTAIGTAIAAYDTGSHDLDLSDDVTLINGSLASAAKLIWAAGRGARPDRLILGLDVWALFAGAADTDGRPLFPGMSGANPVGTITINTQDGEARGLRYVVDPDMEADEAVMGWSRAVTTWLGPVQTMSADVPSLLGRDVAIFQMATHAVRRVDALVRLTIVPETP